MEKCFLEKRSHTIMTDDINKMQACLGKNFLKQNTQIFYLFLLDVEIKEKLLQMKLLIHFADYFRSESNINCNSPKYSFLIIHFMSDAKKISNS